MRVIVARNLRLLVLRPLFGDESHESSSRQGRQFLFPPIELGTYGSIGCRQAPRDRERRHWRRSTFERPSKYGSSTLKPDFGTAIFGLIG